MWRTGVAPRAAVTACLGLPASLGLSSRLGLPALLALGAATGCVVGSPRPPTRLELSRAPSEPPPGDAAELTAPRGCSSRSAGTAASPERPSSPEPAPHAVWVAGACHSTPVQYEWVPGHWEASPPYSWK